MRWLHTAVFAIGLVLISLFALTIAVALLGGWGIAIPAVALAGLLIWRSRR